jgi:hypothetical protein
MSFRRASLCRLTWRGALPSARAANSTPGDFRLSRTNTRVSPDRSKSEIEPSPATRVAFPDARSKENSGCCPMSCACVYSFLPSADSLMVSAEASHSGSISRLAPLATSIAINAKRSASKPGRFIAR